MSPDANPVAPTWKTRLQNWADAEPLRQHEAKILLALTLVIGAVVGLVVVGFILVTENLALRMYPAGGGGVARRPHAHRRRAGCWVSAHAVLS